MLTKLRNAISYNYETGLFTRSSPTTWKKNRVTAGNLTNEGYLTIKVLGVTYQAHRLAMLLHYGECDCDHVDHINHNKTDNRIVNLRAVTEQENYRNKAMQHNNTSGVAGISWYKPYGKWLARISSQGKRICLGYFDTIEEATEARLQAKDKYNYHSNHGEVA